MRTRQRIAFLVLLTLTACGKAPRVDLGGLDYLVDRFKYEASLRGREIAITSLVIEFKPLDKGRMGVCNTGGNIDNTIILNSTVWDRLTETSKENLFFHEMGHCVLNLDHVNNKLAIMNSTMFPDTLYETHRNILLGDLFSL